jgi:uncharacterized protein YrrD
VIDFGFDIMKCHVFEKSGRKLGKVSDFSFDPSSFTVQQIYVQESFLRSLTTTSNIINRQQIVSINNQRIVVDSPDERETVAKKADTTAAFVNPFRQTSPQPERTDTYGAID